LGLDLAKNELNMKKKKYECPSIKVVEKPQRTKLLGISGDRSDAYGTPTTY